MSRFARVTGPASPRVHGAIRLLQHWAADARVQAARAEADGLVMLAASLRGKAKGYDESADALRSLDQGRRLPRLRRGRRKS